MARPRAFVPSVLAVLFGACASAPPPAAAPPPPAAPATSVQPVSYDVPPGHVHRAQLEEVLRQGPPWVLRQVVPEEVIREGRFVGWRVLVVPEQWELHSGDIVMRVNGMTIERPEDLWAAWMQVGSAPEIRIAYERNGAPKEWVIPIDGASSAGTAMNAFPADTPPPPKPRSRWQTIVIEGSDALPAEQPTD